jgi:hypothetical protein
VKEEGTPQDRDGERAGDQQRHGHAQDNQARQQHRPHGGIPGEEEGDDGDEGREAAVAGHKGVGEHGHHPLPGRVDDPAAHNARGVAAKAHAHGEALLAAAMGFLEIAV